MSHSCSPGRCPPWVGAEPGSARALLSLERAAGLAVAVAGRRPPCRGWAVACGPADMGEPSGPPLGGESVVFPGGRSARLGARRVARVQEPPRAGPLFSTAGRGPSADVHQINTTGVTGETFRAK